MDGYERLRAATQSLGIHALRDCAERLVLGLYGQEGPNGELILTTDREWSDEMLDGIIQTLDEYGLHPDHLNGSEAPPQPVADIHNGAPPPTQHTRPPGTVRIAVP